MSASGSLANRLLDEHKKRKYAIMRDPLLCYELLLGCTTGVYGALIRSMRR
jgi:hypothetical protein